MATLKVGMIGLDTSHCEAFVKCLHGADKAHAVRGARVVGAYPGGSQLFSGSYNRVGKFTDTLRDQYGIPMFDSIQDLAKGMDAFLLQSVDGRQHLEQFKILAKYGKPVFIDKPLACSARDARAIVKLARARKVPIMSCSSIRWAAGMTARLPKGANVQGCEAFGPMPVHKDYPRYFWYGVHSVDSLFSRMGRGCRSVRAVRQESSDLLVGVWKDGRIGVVRGIRFGKVPFGCNILTEDAATVAMAGPEPPAHYLMLKQVVKFFKTGVAPIDPEETVEEMAFLDAAGRSLVRKGAAVSLGR